MPAAPDSLTEPQAAAMLGIPLGQLQRMRLAGHGPPCHLSTFSQPTYERAEIDVWARGVVDRWNAALGQVLAHPAAGSARTGRARASRQPARAGTVRINFAPSTSTWTLR